ncbi:unnamed protein product [Mycena citricolor]|uniref:DNA2/NAM7 helicase-like C-terminal domain-containing protein n=1 Tax=Mycena citricolor TaxID=2018698 RepID=A0AAD2JY57_9AGAR|nr:unnamed protein product [Mycena citricolor]
MPSTTVQNIFGAPGDAPLRVIAQHGSQLTPQLVRTFLATATDGIIGIAPYYGSASGLSTLALSSKTDVLLVYIGKKRSSRERHKSSIQSGPLAEVFLSTAHEKAALQMDVLATALYLDLGMRIVGGLDLLSISVKDDRHSNEALISSVGHGLKKDALISVCSRKDTERPLADRLALQAWVAWRAVARLSNAKSFSAQQRIDSTLMSEIHLAALSKIVRDACCLDALKPDVTRNEVTQKFTFKQGELQGTSSRFKTRVQGRNTALLITGFDKEGKEIRAATGRVNDIRGRAFKVQLKGNDLLHAKRIRVRTLGKVPSTGAEVQREAAILSALKGASDLTSKPFFQMIWSAKDSFEVRSKQAGSLKKPTTAIPIKFSRPLNPSQQRAVEEILSPQPVTLIQGPPGTGKTTVIAAVVTSISSAACGRSLWLVAQSNVAVKNIAEKLASVGHLDFKIIVSKEFHFDWHEHLYEKIAPNVIRSDEISQDIVAVERMLLGTKTILCTISMLTSDRLSNVYRIVPVNTVIVDEASQVRDHPTGIHVLTLVKIEIGNYVPLVHSLSRSLTKLVFIGDDKQLPPYGHSDIPSLQSVYELKHLRKKAVFLDTQYRSMPYPDYRMKLTLCRCSMPIRLGSFISQHVYFNKLQSSHKKTDNCCHFIDVPGCKEEFKGHGWINRSEVKAVIAQARRCHFMGQSYRIITPYDAQRAMIEQVLKSSNGLPWEDKVFCVDSFQGKPLTINCTSHVLNEGLAGNEDDVIILSIVRTEKIGFLKESRRVNVMLSRCKQEMRICTSRSFVEGVAADTLIGKLALSVGEEGWYES